MISYKVEELLSRMTLQEKIGQVNQKLFGWNVYEKLPKGDFVLTDYFKAHVAWGGGIGCLYGLFRADPWSRVTIESGISRQDRAKVANMVQQYIKENTRLGIPVLLSEEAPHGHQAIDGSNFPTNIGMGCTFNPSLIAETSASVAEELRKSGAHLALVSLLDMAIDPRWGRTEECFSEDPYLSSVMACAVTTGFQAKGDIAVVAKHFCGQGAGLGGHNAHAANIGERELREIHLPPMRAAISAGVKACMVSYNEIDGILNHSNKWLLRDVLRKELGFTGMVMADGGGIDALNQMTGDTLASATVALDAGVSLSLWDDAYTCLEEALKLGLISEAEIDDAVRYVLTLKFELGLFGDVFTDENLCVANTKELHIKAAQESAVLLKNNGILPLAKEINVAVIGPNGDNLYNQLGDYTAPQRPGIGVTLFKGIGDKVKNVTYTPGCSIRGMDTSGFDAAVEAAQNADMVILALGGSSSREFNDSFADNGAAILTTGEVSEMDCGEGVDIGDLQLGGVQNKLLQRLKDCGKPIVTVLIQGRPHVINEVCNLSDAVLVAWYPGKYGGAAIADLLFGDANPSGRLSVSIPQSSAQLPVYYNYKVGLMRPYADMSEKPLFPFGYGLSYTSFEYTKPRLSSDVMTVNELEKRADLRVFVDVTNVGDMAGYEVIQVYVRDLAATVTRRIKELKGINKVFLQPGETKTVAINLDFEAFALWNRQMKFVVEPGHFEVMVGRNSDNYTVLKFEVTNG